jgi:hypothetical protein
MLHDSPSSIAHAAAGDPAQLLLFLHPAPGFAFSSGEEKVNRNRRQLKIG